MTRGDARPLGDDGVRAEWDAPLSPRVQAWRAFGWAALASVWLAALTAVLGRALGVPARLAELGALAFLAYVLGAALALRARFGVPGAASFGWTALPAVLAALTLLAYPMPSLLGLWLRPGFTGAEVERVCAASLRFGAACLLAPALDALWSRWAGVKPSVQTGSRRASSGTAVFQAAAWAAPGVGCAAVAGAALCAADPASTSFRWCLGAGVLSLAFGGALWWWERRRERAMLELLAMLDGLFIGEGGMDWPDEGLSASRARLRARCTGPLRARFEALDRELAALDREFAAHEAVRRTMADAWALRTRFMAEMSHELRSPLNSVVGFARLLERGLDGELTEGQRESVMAIRMAAEELLSLLTDILDLARLEAGRLRLRCAEVSTAEVLEEARRRAEDVLAGRGVQVELSLEGALPPVWADDARLVQAIVSLVRTAGQALGGGRIRLFVGVDAWRRELRVLLHDVAGAMPRAEAERISHAFAELAQPSGRRLGGLGMSLTLARGLMRLHGGDVWAKADATATVLCLSLPLGEAGQRSSEAKPGRAGTMGPTAPTTSER